MARRSRWVRLAVGGFVAMVIASVLTGCQNGQRQAQFRQELTAGVEALQAGDLDDADAHIAAASAKADSYEQKRQAESLANLSAGARAMIDGDAGEATEQWSAIRDPRLNRQVRLQAADVMDVEVPMAARQEVTP